MSPWFYYNQKKTCFFLGAQPDLECKYYIVHAYNTAHGKAPGSLRFKLQWNQQIVTHIHFS